MPCYTKPSSISEQQYVTIMLCRACKFLTKEQMQSINNIDCYIGLYQWYLSHLLEDVNNNEDNQNEQLAAIKEAQRLGAEIKKKDNCWVLKY
jgi:hypothetical protein